MTAVDIRSVGSDVNDGLERHHCVCQVCEVPIVVVANVTPIHAIPGTSFGCPGSSSAHDVRVAAVEARTVTMCWFTYPGKQSAMRGR